MPTALAYARVSTAEQADHGMSLDAQLRAIRAFASAKGISLVREYVDRGATGTDDDRPEFQAMVEALLTPSNKVEAVIVLHTSRFMRDVELARRYKRELRRVGVKVVAVQQEVGDDANGELMEGIYELFDQHESRIIGVRTRAGMRENARQGFFNGTRPPYGFTAERVALASGREKRRLVEAPAESAIVREIFDGYVSGRGAKALAIELNQSGRLQRGRKWSRDSVLRVISDTAAIGTHYWGLRDTRTGRKRPENEAVAIDVAPLVTRAVFERAQKFRAKRDPVRAERGGYTGDLLLGGLAKCGRCGASLQLEISGKRPKPGSVGYRYYNCTSFCRSGKSVCRGYRVAIETLEKAVVENVSTEALSEERCGTALRLSIEAQAEVRREVRAAREQAVAELAAVDAKIARWVDAFESGGELAELGTERLRSLREERAELQRRLNEKPEPSPVPPYLFKPDVIARTQKRARGALFGGDRRAARTLLNRLVERVEVLDGDVTVYVKGGEIVSLMAERPGEPQPSNQSQKVRTHVVLWRPRDDSNVRPTV